MRNDFHRELENLSADLGAMCELAGTAIGRATGGLLDVDADTARTVAVDAERLRLLSNAVERRVVILLARQAPVAGDLRALVTAIHVAADAERMGGLAAHVARLCIRCHPDSAIPDELRPSFGQMGRLAQHLATRGRIAVLDNDCGSPNVGCDDGPSMDELHRGLFAAVMNPAWSHPPVIATNVVLLARFYGRFADHADEIVRRMTFQITGSYRAALTG